MAAWLIPAVKAILPFVSPIVSAALPVFTTRKPGAPVQDPGGVLQQQITELQQAASQNALHVKALAAQLQKTVTALETATNLAEARVRRWMVLAGAACAFSLLALGGALFALFLR